MRLLHVAAAWLLLAVISISCTPSAERQKFTAVVKDAEDIMAAIDRKSDYTIYENLVIGLAAHMIDLDHAVTTARERERLRRFQEFQHACEDAALFWQYKVDSYLYPWIPGGRVYVDAELKPLVQKYGFAVQQHYLQLTERHWESVDAASLDLLLTQVREQYKKL